MHITVMPEAIEAIEAIEAVCPGRSTSHSSAAHMHVARVRRWCLCVQRLKVQPTCLLLAGILTQLRIWRIVLAKTEMVEHGEVMEGRLRAIQVFELPPRK